MSRLSHLHNMSISLEANLKKIGITTPEELMQIGSKEVFRELKSFSNNITIEDLYALEGAIQNTKIYNISENIKKELEDFYYRYE